MPKVVGHHSAPHDPCANNNSDNKLFPLWASVLVVSCIPMTLSSGKNVRKAAAAAAAALQWLEICDALFFRSVQRESAGRGGHWRCVLEWLRGVLPVPTECSFSGARCVGSESAHSTVQTNKHAQAHTHARIECFRLLHVLKSEFIFTLFIFLLIFVALAFRKTFTTAPCATLAATLRCRRRQARIIWTSARQCRRRRAPSRRQCHAPSRRCSCTFF